MMKISIVLPFLLCVSSSLGIGLVSAQTDPDYQIEIENNTVCSFINANNVNVRQRPDLKSPIIVRLNRGDSVRAVERTNDWVQIVARDSGKPPKPYTPLQGYVYKDYINGCSEDEFDRWRK